MGPGPERDALPASSMERPGPAAARAITRGFESDDFLLIDWTLAERLAVPV